MGLEGWGALMTPHRHRHCATGNRIMAFLGPEKWHL